MNKKVLVAPSILSADFANLQKEIEAVFHAGADWLHVDVMDGHFVPNLTLGAPVVKSIKPVSKVPLDVHLMIEKPEKYIDDFISAGSDIITIHVESTTIVSECIKRIKQANRRAGITLRPATPIEKIEPFLAEVDLVLVMTVNPGFGGQSFMADQVEKIKYLAREKARRNLKFHIEVDGGINQETGMQCVQAGADVLVAGSYVFRHNYVTAISSLRNLGTSTGE